MTQNVEFNFYDKYFWQCVKVNLNDVEESPDAIQNVVSMIQNKEVDLNKTELKINELSNKLKVNLKGIIEDKNFIKLQVELLKEIIQNFIINVLIKDVLLYKQKELERLQRNATFMQEFMKINKKIICVMKKVFLQLGYEK